LSVQGFRFDDDQADDDAWKVWQSNGLDAESLLVHTDALVYGRAFVSVWSDPDGEPVIRGESPLQIATAYAPGDWRTITFALKRWTDVESGYVYATLYTPEEIRQYRSVNPTPVPVSDHGDALGPIELEARGDVIPNPLGLVPIIEFTNRPRLGGRGASEIAGVIPLQDAVNALAGHLLVAAEFGSFKQRWATGLEIPTNPETNEPVEPFDAALTKLWVAEDPATKFGEFGATDLSNFCRAIDMFTAHIASQSSTPSHYLNPSADRLSGESIKSAESGLIAKVRQRMQFFGEAWERVMRLAFATLDDPRSKSVHAEVIWKDPEIRSDSELADAVAKRVAIGVPWSQAMRDLGYSPQEIERMRAERLADDFDVLLPFTTRGGNGAVQPQQP
jgi:hypothetical protein